MQVKIQAILVETSEEVRLQLVQLMHSILMKAPRLIQAFASDVASILVAATFDTHPEVLLVGTTCITPPPPSQSHLASRLCTCYVCPEIFFCLLLCCLLWTLQKNFFENHSSKLWTFSSSSSSSFLHAMMLFLVQMARRHSQHWNSLGSSWVTNSNQWASNLCEWCKSLSPTTTIECEWLPSRLSAGYHIPLAFFSWHHLICSSSNTSSREERNMEKNNSQTPQKRKSKTNRTTGNLLNSICCCCCCWWWWCELADVVHDVTDVAG